MRVDLDREVRGVVSRCGKLRDVAEIHDGSVGA